MLIAEGGRRIFWSALEWLYSQSSAGQPKIRINPDAGRSSLRLLLKPSSASAALYPLRTAPSMVAGQPVAVQSPAKKKFWTVVSCLGRQRSTPGSGEKVAAASL